VPAPFASSLVDQRSEKFGLSLSCMFLFPRYFRIILAASLVPCLPPYMPSQSCIGLPKEGGLHLCGLPNERVESYHWSDSKLLSRFIQVQKARRRFGVNAGSVRLRVSGILH